MQRFLCVQGPWRALFRGAQASLDGRFQTNSAILPVLTVIKCTRRHSFRCAWVSRVSREITTSLSAPRSKYLGDRPEPPASLPMVAGPGDHPGQIPISRSRSGPRRGVRPGRKGGQGAEPCLLASRLANSYGAPLREAAKVIPPPLRFVSRLRTERSRSPIDDAWIRRSVAGCVPATFAEPDAFRSPLLERRDQAEVVAAAQVVGVVDVWRAIADAAIFVGREARDAVVQQVLAFDEELHRLGQLV